MHAWLPLSLNQNLMRVDVDARDTPHGSPDILGDRKPFDAKDKLFRGK